MNEVGVDRGEVVAMPHRIDQLLAHAHQRAGAAGREIEAAEQLLPARLGGLVHRRRRGVRRLGLPVGDGGVELGLVGAEAVRQRLEEGDARPGGQLVVFGKELAGERHAGRLAAAGQKLLAQFDETFRAHRRRGAAVARQVEQRTAAIRDARQHLAEKGGVHGHCWVVP